MLDGKTVITRAASWIDVLSERAATMPNALAYRFLAEDSEREHQLTYGELDLRARLIAGQLQQRCPTGGRAMLLYPPGLDFVTGLFGCWYAGMTAIPAPPPRSARHAASMSALQSIAEDADATTILTTSRVEPLFGDSQVLGSASRLATDELVPGGEDAWKRPSLTTDDLACLQYTSGSTGSPKGVMLSHGNLLHVSTIIRECFGHGADTDSGVSWLPHYHDMGLIGGILQAMYVGRPVTLMAPAAFLQRPIRWLTAISRYRATTSGGPNFAFDLCAKQIRAEEKAGLDLSGWKVAFNGAEPIDAGTIDRFTEAFASCGFRREAFYPCYGLAEASLLVSGGEKNATPIVRTHSGTTPAGKKLVGCGSPRPAGSLVIVDPQTNQPCSDGGVGEVWIHSPSVGKGYFRKPELTAQIFGARLSGRTDGPFLRTGDLGFLQDGELFVTGRLKDLIIIRGVNHYPQDIEQSAAGSHAALRGGSGAAFSVNGDGPERLVIIHELARTQRDVDPQQVVDAIRQAVTEHHEVQVAAVMLLKPGQVPRTSSGKVRRGACRTAFLENTLETLSKWELPAEPATAQPAATPELPAAVPQSATEIEDLMAQVLSEAVSVPAEDIDPAEPFARYGLDSAGAAGVAAKLEKLLGRELQATLFYDYPSIRDLAAYLAATPAEAAAMDTGGSHA